MCHITQIEQWNSRYLLVNPQFHLRSSKMNCIKGDYTDCPAKKYIQLKMFIFEKVWNNFKQNFHGGKNVSLSSFGGIYWLNIMGHYLIISN